MKFQLLAGLGLFASGAIAAKWPKCPNQLKKEDPDLKKFIKCLTNKKQLAKYWGSLFEWLSSVTNPFRIHIEFILFSGMENVM